MYRSRFAWVGAACVTGCLWPGSALAVEPPGIVYQSEAISTPTSAWQLNKRSYDRWMLWTTEQDIQRKRSGGAVLASPHVAADRASPQEGAPPLHSVVTDLKPGVYLVYVSNPGRALAYSRNGKTWFKHSSGELCLGTHHVTDGRFELWVDDRYAYPQDRPGPGYYDYLRFVPVPASAQQVERHLVWHGLERWLQREGRGFAVPAHKTTDWVGFEREGDRIMAGKPGDRFSYVFDRAGAFYLALQMNDDDDGVEQLVVRLNRQEIGCIVAADRHGGAALFSLKQPLKVTKGDTLTFTCQTPVGFYRIHKLYLADKPIIPPPPSIEHVEIWSPEPGSADLCWMTTAVVGTGVVEYGVVGQAGKTIRSPYHGRNHRVQLRGLDPTASYQATILAEYKDKRLTPRTVRFRPVPKTPPPTQSLNVELTVPEPTAHPRRSWPATVGMPFAKGALARIDDLRLFDPAGQAVPLQAETSCRWPDGSVKWATLSFLANSAPAGAGSSGTGAPYVLKAQPKWPQSAPQPGKTVTIQETPQAWRVSTGVLGFDVGKTTPALFHHMGIDRNGDGKIADDERVRAKALGANLKLETGDGTFLTCGPPSPEGIVLESNGPVRAVLKWSGRLVTPDGKPGWAYLIRLTLWNGQPTIGLNASVCNDDATPPFRPISALALRVPLDGAGGVRGGFDGRPLEPVPDAEGLWIHQDTDNHHRLRTGGKTADGKRAVGVAAAADDRTRVTVLIRNFWQTYPSGYAIKPDGVHVRLLPPLAADAYGKPSSEGDPWFARLYAWFKDGKYLFRAGQLTQHDVFVRYDAAGAGGDPDPLRFAAWMSHPLLPQAPPAYLCATGVLGRPLFPRTPGVWDEYEAYFERGFRNTLKDREKRRTYGWMHYGDWFGERYLNYGNNEYDLAWGTGLQWMRTGDRRYFNRGLQMARHFSTVDMLHAPFAESQHCLVWTHCFNHVGTALSVEELRFRADDKAAQAYLERFRRMLHGVRDAQGHVYQQGNWLYAALTGDRWLRDAAERVCAHQARKLTPNFSFGIERSGGWPLINAGAAYNFSGNPYYLNAARIMIERCLQRQDPATGGWLHLAPIGETAGVRVVGGKAFAVGILTHGILRYLEQEPNDRPDVRHMLVRGADWLMNESWNPGKGFRYISRAPNYRDSGGRGATCLLNAEVIAFAHEQTGDPKYLVFWREMMRGMLATTSSSMGKSFSMNVRQTVYGLDRVRQRGITSAPTSP